MLRFGKILCLLVCALGVNTGQAAVVAGIDRQTVALGDTLRLTITATEDEEISDADLRPLLVDFEILQRSTSSNTSIVNGRRTHSKQILLDITPRRQGALEIPPLRVGRSQSSSLSVNVGPPATNPSSQDTVLFEAEVDRDSVYVQGQVILTLRIQRAINLDNLGISELTLDDAFVKQLEQKSFQRNVDGRPWLVHEIRYAIFPAYSGQLEIPAQTFSARESGPRRGFFNLNSGGKMLRRTTQPITIEVLPRPAAFTGDTWLPARLVSIEETWSTPPEQLLAGESTTRSVTISGDGLQGAQLPPVIFEAVEGLKYYPDQAAISDAEIDSGLRGSRQDSAALVPTRAGTWVIPEIRIPWWDTESQRMRFAEIPERTITVGAADATGTSTPQPSPLGDTAGQAVEIRPAEPGRSHDHTIWQLIAALSSAGWLLTLFILWRGRSRRPSPQLKATPDQGESRAFKQLAAACASGSAEHAREALIAWTAASFPQANVLSLDQVSGVFDDGPLDEELARLNRSLFRDPSASWDGTALAEVVKRLRKDRSGEKSPREIRLELYPA